VNPLALSFHSISRAIDEGLVEDRGLEADSFSSELQLLEYSPHESQLSGLLPEGAPQQAVFRMNRGEALGDTRLDAFARFVHHEHHVLESEMFDQYGREEILEPGTNVEEVKHVLAHDRVSATWGGLDGHALAFRKELLEVVDSLAMKFHIRLRPFAGARYEDEIKVVLLCQFHVEPRVTKIGAMAFKGTRIE
jgi:hypothetical protein